MTLLTTWSAVECTLGSMVGLIDLDIGGYVTGQGFLGTLAAFISSLLLSLLGGLLPGLFGG